MSYSTLDSSFVLTNISSTIDYGFTVIPVGMYLPRNDLASDPRTIRFDSKCIADVKHIDIFFPTAPVAVTDLSERHTPIAADTPDGTPINVNISWNVSVHIKMSPLILLPYNNSQGSQIQCVQGRVIIT